MLELIQALPPGARVLDLGAGGGSFRAARSDLVIVRMDLEQPAPSAAPGAWVRADSARLPFASRSFDLVVSNHSLEHFPELEPALREIGRIVKPSAILYVAVPDARTLTDRVYRWLARGGGHVNAFESPRQVATMIQRATGLPHRATRTLFTSFSFLNARNFTSRPPRRMLLFGNGDERFLAAFTWTLRWLDRAFGSRLSVYGWSFYFGDVEVPEAGEDWINVCVRCGSGFSEDFLREKGAVSPIPGRFDRYLCPECGAANRFTRVDL
jgi:SAM-dependent methyltransferase